MSDQPTSDVLDRLFRVIDGRQGGDTEVSYTAKLLATGPPKIGKKITEEAAEVTIAALTEGNDALARESADLLYHLLVMWAATGVRPEDVYAELARREGTSGIAEKNSRADSGA